MAALRILVVDDERQVCEAVRLLLEFDGHTVETADNGLRGLDLIREREYDLVFTDYSMPVMQGDEMATRAKELKPTLPIVMITAHAEAFQSSQTVLTGIDYVLSKPFLLEDLRHALQKVTTVKTDRWPYGLN